MGICVPKRFNAKVRLKVLKRGLASSSKCVKGRSLRVRPLSTFKDLRMRFCYGLYIDRLNKRHLTRNWFVAWNISGTLSH